ASGAERASGADRAGRAGTGRAAGAGTGRAAGAGAGRARRAGVTRPPGRRPGDLALAAGVGQPSCREKTGGETSLGPHACLRYSRSSVSHFGSYPLRYFFNLVTFLRSAPVAGCFPVHVHKGTNPSTC